MRSLAALLTLIAVVVQVQSCDERLVHCKVNQPACEGPFASHHRVSAHTTFCCDTGYRLHMSRSTDSFCACYKEYDVTECIQNTCPRGIKMGSGDNCICARYLVNGPAA